MPENGSDNQVINVDSGFSDNLSDMNMGLVSVDENTGMKGEVPMDTETDETIDELRSYKKADLILA